MDMSHWKVSAPTLVVLSCVAILMLLIVVLPDVDLPDTAFHGGTAPVLVHTRATAPPAAIAIASIPPSRQNNDCSQLCESRKIFDDTDSNFLPIKLRSIRC